MTVYRRRRFADLPGWTDADHAAAFRAFRAFRASAPRFVATGGGAGGTGGPAGALAFAVGALEPAARAALADGEREPHAARSFFETHFEALRVLPDTAAFDEPEPGFVTGYYEPVLEASPTRTARFDHPLYARPQDLVAVDEVSRPPGLDPAFGFARRRPDGLLEEYPDRAAIEAGALAGRDLELAWLADPVDAFFVHVQGSARLRFPDGRAVRVGYAGKTGHPYTSIARVLVEAGELQREDADMAGLRAWLAAHPDRQRAILERNRSFIFFRETAVREPELGPVGAAGVPLTPMVSLAVDDALGAYGLPYFVSASRLAVEGEPFRRLMVAQDTGSAIQGPARGDIFVGSGAAAGTLAGTIRHRADVTLLMPPDAARRLAP